MKNGILNLVFLCISAGQIIAAPITSNPAVEVLQALDKRGDYVANCQTFAESVGCNENGNYMYCENTTIITNNPACGRPYCYCSYFIPCISHCSKEQEELETKLVAGQASAQAAQADNIE